jgi:y4mF family transcriptional regulator
LQFYTRWGVYIDIIIKFECKVLKTVEPEHISIGDFLRLKRKQLKLTQPEMARMAGVGLRFVRELEHGKERMRMDKVNLVLRLFGKELGLTPLNREKLLHEKG